MGREGETLRASCAEAAKAGNRTGSREGSECHTLQVKLVAREGGGGKWESEKREEVMQRQKQLCVVTASILQFGSFVLLSSSCCCVRLHAITRSLLTGCSTRLLSSRFASSPSVRLHCSSACASCVQRLKETPLPPHASPPATQQAALAVSRAFLALRRPSPAAATRGASFS